MRRAGDSLGDGDGDSDGDGEGSWQKGVLAVQVGFATCVSPHWRDKHVRCHAWQKTIYT
jgi:hypothetical protein